MNSSLVTTWIWAVSLCVVAVFAGVLFMIDSYQSNFSRVAYFMSDVRPALGGGVSPFWQAVLLVLIAAIPASILSGIFNDYRSKQGNKAKATFSSIAVWVITFLAVSILVISIYI